MPMLARARIEGARRAGKPVGAGTFFPGTGGQTALKQLLKEDRERAKMTGSAIPANYKKGGTVKKTGMAKVHKGEKVVPKKSASKRMKK